MSDSAHVGSALPQSPPPCVVIAGMHRSGTSALGAALEALGLWAGDDHDLLEANAGNPRGYWEPRELVELDDRILSCWQASWCNPRWRHRPRKASDLPPALRAAMEDYGLRWRKRGKAWLWKDPRLSLTLPYWASAVEITLLIVAVRDPREVAASLATRDGIKPQVGLVMWEAYARALLEHMRHLPHLVVDYEQLLGAPLATLSDVANGLCGHIEGFGGDPELAAHRIAPELRHQVAGTGSGPPLSPAQAELYRRLREADLEGQKSDPDEERERLIEACLELTERQLLLERQSSRWQSVQLELDGLERRKAVRLMRWYDAQRQRLRGGRS
ncbi:MAG: sulfotransferase [Myxococcales bacterium]|nr:sulfotransferase [Myxococcales bacterium]